MSSGGWEIVGKHKKDKNNEKYVKLTKVEKKKFIENAPKVEDFLPLSQVKSLYDNLDNNKENKRPSKAKENKSKENEEKKKQQKQQQHSEKKKQESKGKTPKTIKEALYAINAKELNDILTADQSRFPDAPLIWLKDLAAFLNVKLPVEKEDVIFSGKPTDYPLNIVPKTITSILENAIEMAGQQTTQLFYEITLTTMTTYMAKGVPVIGYKIFLQLLAYLNPEMTIVNIPKLIAIRNSYQNRKPVGLSLLWAMSQAGKKNLTVGLKVWHEVMSPMIETKSYASDVTQILSDLVFRHENVYDLSPDLYFNIIETVYSGKLNIPSAMSKEINVSIEKLRTILFKNKNLNYTKLFEVLIDKVSQKGSINYKEEVMKALVACLITDIHCFSVWRSLYMKHLYQSNLLITYIDTKWDIFHKTLKRKPLEETLTVFQITNERWKKGKDENLVVACNKACQALSKKMTVSKRSISPWRIGSLLLLLLIGAIVAFDYRKHGTFEASAIGKFLTNSGISAYGEKVLSTIKSYTPNEFNSVKDNASTYYEAVTQFGASYIKLTEDLYIIMKNLSYKIYKNVSAYVDKNGPMVLDTIDHYISKLREQIYSGSIQIYELGKHYSIYFSEQITLYSDSVFQWVEKSTFVEKYNAGDLVYYIDQGAVVAQEFANWIYDWVHYYAPNLTEQICSGTVEIFEFGKKCELLLAEQLNKLSVWLETNVFVGKLSPENLQNYATQAIDITQTFASQTYDWIYDKVQTLSKNLDI